MRLIEPIAGLPRITIRFRPTYAHGRTDMERAFGSNHIRYTGGNTTIRLTTDAPLAYIDRESPFVLSRPVSLVFGADTPFEGDLATTCREFAERTRDYWQEWLRRLAISYEWQDAVMRAAITLKLSSFEETGAIIAAQTTSVPEAPGSGRTWDYRFCWLRDAYFVVHALNRIGASRTMEDYISYILTIVSGNSGELQPVYNIVSTDPLEERIVADLKGYRGDGPVRIGNAAVAQNQHDTYGSVILAATPMFFDRRLPRMGDENLFRRLEPLGELARETRAQARRRHLGIPRAQAHPHPFGRDVLGRLPPAGGDRGASRPRRARRLLGRARARHSRRDAGKGLEREARRLHGRRSAPTISTPACCCCPNSARSKPPTRVSSRPSRRSSGNSSAISTLCATAARTISVCRRRRS